MQPLLTFGLIVVLVFGALLFVQSDGNDVLSHQTLIERGENGGSAPGDTFYTLDRWMERVRARFADDPESEARIALDNAIERAQELQTSAERGNTNGVEEALDGFKKSIAEALEHAYHVSEPVARQRITDATERITAEAEPILSEVSTQVEAEAQRALERAVEEMQEELDLVFERIKARAKEQIRAEMTELRERLKKELQSQLQQIQENIKQQIAE